MKKTITTTSDKLREAKIELKICASRYPPLEGAGGGTSALRVIFNFQLSTFN